MLSKTSHIGRRAIEKGWFMIETNKISDATLEKMAYEIQRRQRSKGKEEPEPQPAKKIDWDDDYDDLTPAQYNYFLRELWNEPPLTLEEEFAWRKKQMLQPQKIEEGLPPPPKIMFLK